MRSTVESSSARAASGPFGLTRRVCLCALLPLAPTSVLATPAKDKEKERDAEAFRRAMEEAERMREAAVAVGDQAYGAVVLKGGDIVGSAPSRVVIFNDPTAHAEREALRDASLRLGTNDLSTCVLVSTSRPCAMCEATASRARIARMVWGEALTDAGRPR